MKNSPKFHRPVLSLVPVALEDTFIKGFYGDKVVEYHLKKKGKKFGSRDRRQFAQIYYDILRWFRRLSFCLGDLDPQTPSDFWKFVEAWLILQGEPRPEWMARQALDPDIIQKKWNEFKKGSVFHSIPDWMYELGLEELGEQRWEDQLTKLNKRAPLILRANELKTSPEELLTNINNKEKVSAQLLSKSPPAIQLQDRQNVFQWPEFKEGLFEVQDYGSQQIAPYLNVEPGHRVLDACAGAGGKSLHLAALMKNKGKIIATDIHEWKLKELKKRAKRNGVDIIETRVIDRKWIKRQKQKFDRILLDVPCSGMGVLKRNPDSKWKLSPESIEQVKETQKQILFEYSEALKVGGELVYSTCSLLPSENEGQVQQFLFENKGWQLLEEKNIPVSESTDGFYMARLQQKSLKG